MTTPSWARPLALAAAIATASAAAIATVPAAARAQQGAVITGRVTTQAGAPVGGAIVSVRSAQATTTTDDAGAYRLVVPAARAGARQDTLRVNRIGYRPAAVPFALAPGAVTVNVTMADQAVALDQVVVTGTAGNQERRAQPAVVATIDAADIVAKAPVRDVNELLYSRTPGLSMTRTSGTAGANTRIDIRGQASVSLSNYPLVFVDGVRVAAGPRSVIAAPGGTTAGAGGQQLSALNDIPPEDIESIEIVKGPAAATLYGADASAGVIQILTKRGRAGARHLEQRLTAEYANVDPNFTPFTNYAKCTAALVAATSTNPLCRGQAVGAVISDDPATRYGFFDDAPAGSLRYNLQGGGESFGYFASFNADNERSTSPGGYLSHRTGRVNANWVATPRLSMDVSLGLVRANDRLPQGDQSSYGPLINAGFGSALTVATAADGQVTGGLLNNNLSVAAISAIDTRDLTLRSTPSVQVRYAPVSWFSNRLTVGGDFARTTASQMYPRNDRNWYSAVANTGSVAVNESNSTVYTVDYIGNVTTRLAGGRVSSDLSFGSQWINTTGTSVSGTGQGLLTNANNLISAATTTTASQGYGQAKSLGLVAQEQVGFGDRLYVQVGGRLDRNSAFGSNVGSFFLPKAGVSWVVSQESFWRSLASAVPTLRLRAAYGTTGRSPSGTAAIQTYARSNYITDQGVVQPGVSPGNPGNPDLKPERGTELEGGFDAGFLHDRVGLEVTYFDKRSKDLLLSLPLPPSAGFASNPLVNIGEVSNKGLELQLRATPVDLRNVSWSTTINASTLKNRIVNMGNVTPFVSANNQCFKPGIAVAAWCVPRVLSVDTVARRTVVSDTAEAVGSPLPKYTASLLSTLTLFRNVRLYAQLDGKWNYRVYNLTRDFRDRSFANSAESQLPAGEGGFSAYERQRRLGPFFAERSGAAVGTALVRDPYVVPGDFVRLREASVSWSAPTTLARRARVGGLSVSVGGTNLGLWTKYDGWDPEVVGTVDNTTPNPADVFTLPQSRRTFVRVNLQF